MRENYVAEKSNSVYMANLWFQTTFEEKTSRSAYQLTECQFTGLFKNSSRIDIKRLFHRFGDVRSRSSNTKCRYWRILQYWP